MVNNATDTTQKDITLTISKLAKKFGLSRSTLLKKPKKMTNQMWSSIRRASGLTEEGMRNWHITFEREAPEQHKTFLQYLQISDDEIELIRSWAVESPTQS